MHVHLPKPLHGWREFAGEVGIIVLGVLIALGAEQAVEDWHWHQKVGHAEDAMRLELAEDDGPQAYGRVLIGPCLNSQLARIHDGVGKVAPDQLRQWALAYLPPFRSWDSEAWKAVLASDVGSHMGPERLVQWSSPYRVITDMTASNRAERDLATELREALPPVGEPSPDYMQTLRRDAAQLQTANSSLFRASQLLLARSTALGAPVPKPMQQELFVEARRMYGGCVHLPDMNALPIAARLRGNLRLQPIQNGM
ncbi:MAG TPA: hypothetical protein VE820_11060 [Sphingomicrobium sp.]|jgi:hypothetical protein|nr:hypothetical protein [Sphingomicrobium sp.]